MRDVVVTIKGLTPYSASRHFDIEKTEGATAEDHDKKHWREKAHYDEDGNVVIPGVCFKLALDEAAARKNEKIKGRGNQTYTGLFKSGVTAMSDMVLAVKKDDLRSITIFSNLDGKRGGSSRGNRTFPIVASWGGTVEFRVFNDDIAEADFERFFAQAGLIAGVGRGRPSTGCPAGNGRFTPTEFKWSKV